MGNKRNRFDPREALRQRGWEGVPGPGPETGTTADGFSKWARWEGPFPVKAKGEVVGSRVVKGHVNIGPQKRVKLLTGVNRKQPTGDIRGKGGGKPSGGRGAKYGRGPIVPGGAQKQGGQPHIGAPTRGGGVLPKHRVFYNTRGAMLCTTRLDAS